MPRLLEIVVSVPISKIMALHAVVKKKHPQILSLDINNYWLNCVRDLIKIQSLPKLKFEK